MESHLTHTRCKASPCSTSFSQVPYHSATKTVPLLPPHVYEILVSSSVKPSILLGVEMHCENRASQPRLQHNHFSPGLETRPLDLKSSMSIHTQASASLDTGRKAYPPHKYQLSLFQDTNICKYLFEQILH